MNKKIFLYLVSICVATSVLAGDLTAQVREQFAGAHPEVLFHCHAREDGFILQDIGNTSSV